MTTSRHSLLSDGQARVEACQIKRRGDNGSTCKSELEGGKVKRQTQIRYCRQ